MATFEIIEGAPGQGKSLYTAKKAIEILYRNKKWFESGNPRRVLYSNLKFSAEFEKKWEGYLAYWSDASQLVKLNDVDILFDEIATELDSRNWATLSNEFKRFLSQYRKRGIDIYANTQDFSMIDVRARLMVSKVCTLTKIIGSRDISTTKPPPRFIWGLILVREVINYKETSEEKKKYVFLPSAFFITQDLVSIYDTRQDISLGQRPPLKHEVLVCENHGVSCSFSKVVHN